MLTGAPVGLGIIIVAIYVVKRGDCNKLNKSALILVHMDSLFVDLYHKHTGFHRLHDTVFISYRIRKRLDFMPD